MLMRVVCEMGLLNFCSTESIMGYGLEVAENVGFRCDRIRLDFI